MKWLLNSAAASSALVLGIAIATAAQAGCHDPAAPNVDWSGCGMSGADLSDKNLTGANLKGANLSNADLDGATLSKASLVNTNLRFANLINANLSGAVLTGATLSKAYMNGANLSAATLQGATLTGANLTNVLWLDGKKTCANPSIGLQLSMTGVTWRSRRLDTPSLQYPGRPICSGVWTTLRNRDGS